MNRKSSIFWLALGILCLPLIFSRAACAVVIDDLDGTTNFSAGFGGTVAISNGDGTVSLIRTNSGVDAGIDWRPGGNGFFQLDGEQLLTLTPVASSNNAMFNVDILFWSVNPGDPTHPVFIGEFSWLTDSASLSIRNVDVAQFAAAHNVIGATEYFIRIRVDPFNFSGGAANNPAFQFTQFQAVPEPAVTIALLAGILALSLGHRWIGSSRAEV